MRQNRGADLREDLLLGIDVGGTKVALLTATLAGEELDRSRIPTGADEGARAVVERVLAAAGSLVARSRAALGVRAGSLVAVGVSTPGVVREHGVLLAPNNPGWDTLPLRATVSAAFPGTPVAVVNDVRAAALAEVRLGALAGVGTGLYVNVGTGTSAAVVVGGAVLDGAHGAAGEVAYQVRSAAEPGFAAGRAPLEERVSGAALRDRVSAVAGRPVEPAEAFAIAPEYPQVQAVLDDALDALAVLLVNAAVTLDPARIVLGGGLATGWPGLVPRLAGALRQAVPFPPEVLLSALGDDAALRGAVVAADQARSGATVLLG